MTTSKFRVPIPPFSIRADWVAMWTAQMAESQLDGFRFEGPGWYHEGADTMLVVPVDRQVGARMFDPVAADEDDEERFEFHVFNDRNPARGFGWIASAPTHNG